MIKHKLLLVPILSVIVLLTSCLPPSSFSDDAPTPTVSATTSSTASQTVSLDAIPDYSNEPSIVINNNIPYFTDSDLDLPAGFEYYSDLDSLGRCGVCYANVGVETMPTEPRGEIGMVKPSGWHTVRYDGLVDGNYLYNRCHLLGYQLSGENANEKNLITGTRYLNVQGMLPYENQVAEYVEETGNRVVYRVTPLYDDEDLVAKGVLMEAWSTSDDGCRFCVYCYNVQPGVTIDYTTGESWLSENDPESTETQETTGETLYILNTNSKKFHNADCSGAANISDTNREESTATRETLISEGYSPCGICKP